MKFNEKIVRLRKSKGMTQEELAEAVGVSRQAVYKWECGQSYPEVAKLLEIKLLFGISIDDLLDEAFEVAPPEKKKRKRAARVTASVAEENKEAAPTEEPIEVINEAEPVIEVTVPEVSPITEVKAEQAAPEATQAVNTEKKRGFFSRLFGRK